MQTVIITGAAGGIGVDVTDAFLRSGWRVRAVCRTNSQVDYLRAECNDYGDALTVCTADLSREEDVAQCVGSDSGDLRALVHLVGGFSGGKPLEETDADVLERMMSTHVRTTFLMMRAVLPALKRTGGSIVTIGARAVLHPAVNNAAYAAAKSAVASLTRSVAEEGKPYNVRANCILPGVLATPANLEWGSEDDVQQWTKPEDIASAALFLCSDAAAGISGALIPMFGKLPS